MNLYTIPMVGMILGPVDGWLPEARRVSSPNCDMRPVGVEICLIVVHGISLPPGEYGGPWIDQLFTNQLVPTDHPYFSEIVEQRVSAHLLIRRDGELVQYVDFNSRAWHAGSSMFRGREACNDFSIGIELEGSDEEPYTDTQYQRLAAIVVLLQRIYPAIKSDHILGHCDISAGRKTDPGPAFSWLQLTKLLESAHSS